MTGNNTEVLLLPAAVPFTSVSGSAFGNEPSTFGVLFGVFSFDDEGSSSGRQACLVHNQRTNFPALFTLGLASGFTVTEFSEKSRAEVNPLITSASQPMNTH